MKKGYLVVFTLLLAVLIGTASGCDNRSQLEKDADRAAKNIQGALK